MSKVTHITRILAFSGLDLSAQCGGQRAIQNTVYSHYSHSALIGYHQEDQLVPPFRLPDSIHSHESTNVCYKEQQGTHWVTLTSFRSAMVGSTDLVH